MKYVHYYPKTQWIGFMDCPDCKRSIPVWQSSGMSECYPHFYCTKCSNVMYWDKGKDLLFKKGFTEDTLEMISSQLPECSCGGRFSPGQAPKCECGFEFSFTDGPIERLKDPHILLLTGAMLFKDGVEQYTLKIHLENISNGKRILECDNCSLKYALPLDVAKVKTICPHCGIKSTIKFSQFGYDLEMNQTVS